MRARAHLARIGATVRGHGGTLPRLPAIAPR